MTAKPIAHVMTAGVSELVDTGILPDLMLIEMFSIAEDNYKDSYFITFQPNGFSKTKVTDGNENILTELDFEVPKKIWLITDDYGDHFVCTALLPEEY